MSKVSVIIPTHSRPHLLPRAVESAKAAGGDVEVIVVDDASTDGTAEVCRGLKGVSYIRLEQNQGVAGARNVGILASSADYVAFLDDDDLRLPGTLDYQAEALSKNKEAGFVCGQMLMADQEGRLTGEVAAPKSSGGDAFWELLELGFPVMPISVVIRKECFARVGLLQTDLSGIDDWDIFVRIAELYHVVVVDRPVSIYRQPTPSSGQGSSAQSRHLRNAARHQLQLLRLPRAQEASARRRREARRLALRRIADTLLWNAALGLSRGSYSFACRNTLAALRLSPLRALRPAGYGKLALRLLRGDF
ncbi:MAG TPA: glycosyltransferase family 2 protein [Pyrinomonadaceae bacterium]|nr:glycosyltransferase family 2 protein [Pyrinomonadaceae bacterium]